MFYCFLIPLLLFFADKAWYFRIFSFKLFGRETPLLEICNAICLVLFLVGFLFKRNAVVKSAFANVIRILGLNLIICYLVGSVTYYDQDPARVFRVLFWYSGVLIFFFLAWRLKNEQKTTRLFYAIVLYGVIASFVSIIVIQFNLSEIVFSNEVISERFGTLRISRIAEEASWLAFFYFIAYFVLAGKGRKKYSKIHIFGLFVTLYCLFFIRISRQAIISFLIMAAFSAVAFSKTKLFRRNKKLIALVLIAFVGFFAVKISRGASISFFDQFIQSFDTKAEVEGSSSLRIRIEALKYYYKEFVHTNFIGMGWVSTSEGMSENAVNEALRYKGYFLSDLGIFATFFQYGFIALFTMAYFLVHAWKYIKFLNRFGNTYEKRIATAIGLFLLMRLFSLNYLFYWHSFAFFYGLLMFFLYALKNIVVQRLVISREQL